MGNLKLYNEVRAVPENAQREIKGGRLKGKTDINPMWRIKALTEQFGPCGIGWKYVDKKKWIEEGANGERAAFVDIDLYIKDDGKWSEPVPGTGGSMLVEKESGGLHTNDECYKMALTDAISVACKALGFGADVYWNADTTKYGKKEDKPKALSAKQDPPTLVTMEQAKALKDAASEVYGDSYAQLFTEATGYTKFGLVPASKYEEVMKIIRGDK